MDETLRLKIMRKMQALLKDVDENFPPDDPLGFKFSKVTLGSLGQADTRLRCTAAVVPGSEKKVDLYPFKEPVLRVQIEFRISVQANDDEPMVMIERLLGLVQLVFSADTTLGGTVIDVQEVGNEVDLFVYGDKTPAGVVQYDVKYRHRHNDPRYY